MLSEEQKLKLLQNVDEFKDKIENDEVEGCAIIFFDKGGETNHSLCCPNEMVPLLLFNMEIMKASMISGAMADHNLSYQSELT